MLNASIVTYRTDQNELNNAISQLQKSSVVDTIFVVNNSGKQARTTQTDNVVWIENDRNLGYGRAHNIAMRESLKRNADYHLVLNSDVEFDPKILAKIVEFMDQNSEVGALMPKVLNPDGSLQYLCKLVPTPWDLFVRRFLPRALNRHHNQLFTLQKTGYESTMDIPYLSGCFMFLRCETLQKVGLFDERYFLYPEDIDLTRRIASKARTVYFPEVAITHEHGHGSYKNLKLFWHHSVNICRYFNKWGWFCDRERREINKKTLNKLNLR